MDIHTKDSVAEIRRLNDQLRTTFRGGKILLTQCVADLPDLVKATVLTTIAAFRDFNEENDPAEEHDYGSFDYVGLEVWWKIDCFDLKMEMASPDPADPTKTKRIMTIGLAQDR